MCGIAGHLARQADAIPVPNLAKVVLRFSAQVGEQPSNGRVLPSSHCSVPSLCPSPQTVA
jgi:hypothetical protein